MGIGQLGLQEVLIVLAICLLIFGPRQLPKLGKALGDSLREFKNVGKELRSSVNLDDEDK